MNALWIQTFAVDFWHHNDHKLKPFHFIICSYDFYKTLKDTRLPSISFNPRSSKKYKLWKKQEQKQAKFWIDR